MDENRTSNDMITNSMYYCDDIDNGGCDGVDEDDSDRITPMIGSYLIITTTTYRYKSHERSEVLTVHNVEAI